MATESRCRPLWLHCRRPTYCPSLPPPPAPRPHREEDKQPLIWAPQPASLFPSAPAPRARPRGTAGQRTGSSSHLRQHPAGRSGRARAGPGMVQVEGTRGSGANGHHRHQSLGKAVGSSAMSGSDKGAQRGRPGRSDKGAVIFVLQEKEKKKNKKERKENPFYVFPAARPLPRSGAAETKDQGWSHCGLGASRGIPVFFGSGSKALGKEQQPGLPGWGGAGLGWLRRRRMPHGTGSATLASRHPAVPPRHLCNELPGLSMGQGWDGYCTANLKGGGLSASETPLAPGPCGGGIGAQITGCMGPGSEADAGHTIPALL